ETRPDRGLPAAVVVLDGGLEAGLARRRENGRDAQRQAEPDDAPDGVGMSVGAGEDPVVVELRVGGQAGRAPVLQERIHGVFRGDSAAWPGGRQAAVQADGVENLDVDGPSAA